MSRYSSAKAYGQTISRIGGGYFRMHWTVDRYYKGSRLRHPTGYTRDADRKGAERFCKKWGIDMPKESTP